MPLTTPPRSRDRLKRAFIQEYVRFIGAHDREFRAVVHSRISNYQDAEDCLQATYTIVFQAGLKAAGEGSPIHKLVPYARTVRSRRIIDYFRQRQRRREIPLVRSGGKFPAAGASVPEPSSPGFQLEAAETLAQAGGILDEFRDRERQAYIEVEIKRSMTQAQYAAKVDRKQPWVSKVIGKIRRRLAARVTPPGRASFQGVSPFEPEFRESA